MSDKLEVIRYQVFTHSLLKNNVMSHEIIVIGTLYSSHYRVQFQNVPQPVHAKLMHSERELSTHLRCSSYLNRHLHINQFSTLEHLYHSVDTCKISVINLVAYRLPPYPNEYSYYAMSFEYM